MSVVKVQRSSQLLLRVIKDLQTHPFGTAVSIGRRIGTTPKDGTASALVNLFRRGYLIRKGTIQGNNGCPQYIYALNPEKPADAITGIHASTLSITHNGETMNVSEWADRLGIHQTSLSHRIRRYGIDRAMTMPNGRWPNSRGAE